MKKKTVSLLLSAVLCTGILAGCTEQKTAAPVGTSDNEIVTYTRLDPDKTTLYVGWTGNINVARFAAAFEEQNPDIQTVCLDITGGTVKSRPVIDQIKQGMAPDILFSTNSIFTDDVVLEYLTNLSTSPLVENYNAEALNKNSIDGEIYWLPGPSNVECMLYNRTLFEQYGWQIPTSFDEFVSLCDQITADTNGEVVPWNPNAKYPNEFLIVMEGFLYEQLFAGTENRTWYDSVIEGNASFSDHMKPMYDAIQTLIDHGILKEEHFTYSATARLKEFTEGKIAMINFTAETFTSNEKYDFDLMPFPSTTGNLGYIDEAYSCLVSVPKKDHTEKEQDAIDRFLTYFSSKEGQDIFIGNTLQVSNVKDVGMDSDESMSGLQEAISQGHLCTLLDFTGENGKVNADITADAKAMTVGEKTEEECLTAIDADPYLKNGTDTETESEVLATAAENFTILETSSYLADMYREKMNADVGLIANNLAWRGNLMKILAGDLTADNVTTLLPRSLESGSALIKVNMTGQQLLDTLNNPLGGTDGSTADCVYAWSGLKGEVAPWNEQGSRILSVTLSDGTAIDPEKTYSVAFWQGTVADQYIGEITDTCEGTWADIMCEKLKKDQTISPADDGRMTLVWE